MSSTRVLANKYTTALYILSSTLNINFTTLLCLYEIYKEDIFCIFYMLAGKSVTFDKCVKKFPHDRMFERIFDRAQNLYDALQGYPRRIKRYDMKHYRALEKMYKNGLYYVDTK